MCSFTLPISARIMTGRRFSHATARRFSISSRTRRGSTIWKSASRVERWLTPQDIHDRYHVLNGAIYGLASHGRLTGAFKPANRNPDVPRLYLAGGAAHPGPGMPMVLMSGWIAANTLAGDGVVELAAGPLGVSDPASGACHGHHDSAEGAFE